MTTLFIVALFLNLHLVSFCQDAPAVSQAERKQKKPEIETVSALESVAEPFRMIEELKQLTEKPPKISQPSTELDRWKAWLTMRFLQKRDRTRPPQSLQHPNLPS